MAENPANRQNVFFGIIALATMCAIVIAAMSAWTTRSTQFRSGSNLKRAGIAFKIYAPADYYPTLSSEPGRLMFDPSLLYPRIMPDLHLLMSPADPEVATDPLTSEFVYEHCSYFYPGYVLLDDETVETFEHAYWKRIDEGTGFETELPVDLPIENLIRLDSNRRRGGFVGEDLTSPKYKYSRYADSQTPILIESPRPYPGRFGLYFGVEVSLSDPTIGGHVLFLDGHVEFIPYPGKWPMTERTIGAMKRIRAGERPQTKCP
jgi:prepilin-type processing-associated H-X9-DG protein